MIKQRNVVLNILLTEGKTFVAFLIEEKQGTVLCFDTICFKSLILIKLKHE